MIVDVASLFDEFPSLDSPISLSDSNIATKAESSSAFRALPTPIVKLKAKSVIDSAFDSSSMAIPGHARFSIARMPTLTVWTLPAELNRCKVKIRYTLCRRERNRLTKLMPRLVCARACVQDDP